MRRLHHTHKDWALLLFVIFVAFSLYVGATCAPG